MRNPCGFNNKLANPLVIGQRLELRRRWLGVSPEERRIAGLELRFIVAQPEARIGEVVDAEDEFDR